MPSPAHIYSLSDVTKAVTKTLKPVTNITYWVRAEIGSQNTKDGNIYATLVESDDGERIAQMKCNIWQSYALSIRAKFRRENLDFELREGMSVVLLCRLDFHAVYGLSLVAVDADPSFAIGELELRKRKLIEQLLSGGAEKHNKLLTVPALPLRIGLITSFDSAVYNDILRTLRDSGFGFRIYHADSSMQGEQTEPSILCAFDVLERLAPDLIILARGGGNRTELAWLDSEAIARRIASCTVPVWSAIGHEIDSGVPDLIAHSTYKTPTAAAEAIVKLFTDAVNKMQHAHDLLFKHWTFALNREKQEVIDNCVGIQQGTRKLEGQIRSDLQARALKLRTSVERRVGALHQSSELRRQNMHTNMLHRLEQHHSRTDTMRDRLRTAACSVTRQSDMMLRNIIARFVVHRMPRRIIEKRAELARTRVDVAKCANRKMVRHNSQVTLMIDRLRREPWRVRFAALLMHLKDKQATILAHDPANALRRGYAMLFDDGRMLTSISALTPGVSVTIAMKGGTAKSTINEIQESND